MTIISHWRKLYVREVAKYTAVGPDCVDQCNLFGYHFITAAGPHFTSFLLLIPFFVVLALLSPSQLYKSDPWSYSELPPLIPTTEHALTLSREKIGIFFHHRFASSCTCARF